MDWYTIHLTKQLVLCSLSRKDREDVFLGFSGIYIFLRWEDSLALQVRPFWPRLTLPGALCHVTSAGACPANLT
jgi:hypothetical protein